MGRRRRHERGNPVVVLVIICILLAGAYYLNEVYEPGPPASTGKSGGFTVLDGCRLIEDANRNDGDSFRVRHGDDEYVFRLYFVDCPEKRVHSYDRERIANQGKYFGGLSQKETIRLGEDATEFTLNLLRKSGSFTVLTKWEEVYSSGRFYGLILPGIQQNNYLHEDIVRQGLARIYTRGVDLPDRKKIRHIESLRALESEAKADGLGGWRRSQ